MKILITGATGFVGRQLAVTLAEQGLQVVALCRNINHPLLINHKNITPIKGDILDAASLQTAMQGCTQIYHTAAMAKMWCKDKNDFYKVNVTGTKNVLEAAKNAGVNRLVYTSSCGVLGPTIRHPMNEDDPRVIGFAIDYERTKYLAQLEVNKSVAEGLNVVTVLPSRVYGEGPVTESNTVGKMVSKYIKGKWRLMPGNGKLIANYAYLNDVVKGHIAAMEKGMAGQHYILGGEDISFNEFFSSVSEYSNKHYKLINVPEKLIQVYSYIELFKTKLTGFAPLFLPEFASRLSWHQKYSSQKAIEHLGYSITPFSKGIQNTIDYLKKN